MKRKIPARKHHGVRDPIKQNELRLFKIKDKINNPPEKRDHQNVSRKLADFIKLKDKTKDGKKFKLKRSIENEDKPEKSKKLKNARQTKEIKAIKQLPNETDKDYLRRVNRITQESLKEAEYEAKYGVNVVRNEKTGEISIKKRPKDEIIELMKKNKRNKPKGDDKTGKVMDKAKSRELIKQALKELKEEKNKGPAVQEYKRDNVKFGEIVHAPPSITTLPRKAQKPESVSRPGQKNNLLLQSLMSKDQPVKADNSKKKEISIKSKKIHSKIDLKGKRKDLPMATRRMLETQQNEVVEMYRQIKKNKMKK